MSYRKGHEFSIPQNGLATQVSEELNKYSEEDLVGLWSKTLQAGMHGLCFSMYEDGQQPGDIISEAQVERRIEIIKPYTKWVRSFSCIEGNEHIPAVARRHGMKTLVGAWLGHDKELNRREIDDLIALAQEGVVDIAAVGNEVMYRGDLSEEELIAHIQEVRSALPDHIPVGYVDAYYEFRHRPNITAACDVLLANCYPFWEGCPIDHALNYMRDMFGQVLAVAEGKRVIITETGWPNQGESLKGSHPSVPNALKYFIQTQQWSKAENVDLFYFSSFDESWKIGDEGEVGAYWGLWDKHEQLKYVNKVL